jgi:hypothetical protein
MSTHHHQRDFHDDFPAAKQGRISDLLARIWQTKKSQPQTTKNEWENLVDGMGLEPTTPALRTRCSPN